MTLKLRRLLEVCLIVTLLTPALHLISAETTGRKRVAAPVAPKMSVLPSDKEYYLTEEGIAYIRPGLKIVVKSVTIPADRKPVVDLFLTDSLDQPLDRLGKTTPGPISLSFVLGWYNPASRLYTAYTVRTQTTPASSPRPGVSAVQAAADTGGRFTDLETGHSTYTFGTALPATFDATKTHTLGIYSTRNLTEQLGKSFFANAEFDFRPDGRSVTETWAKINQATSCNNCHDPLNAHGGSRQDVKLCALCHTPQTTDPDTGNTVDMRVMAHKIHYGPNLPSVKAGTPYQIIGNAQSLHDFSDVEYPQDTRNCANCHEGTNAAQRPTQAMLWLTNPSRDACGSCHDDIDWKTGKGHVAGAQLNDDACASCHVPDSGEEFDASIKGAHVIPEKSKQLKGLTASVVSVTDLAPGKKPTVVFAIKNGDGSAVDGSKLTSFAPMVAGSTTNYTKYIREAGQTRATFNPANGTTSYTFTASLPADAKGTWTVSGDIYRNATIKRADGEADITLREAAFNPVRSFAVTGTLTARRQVVTTAQCNACHDRLAPHGGQRMNVEECVICHNPVESDVARRPANAGQPESVSFQRMIHRIHTGEELTQDFTIYGFGGTPVNFNGIVYPGDRRNCAKCHVNNSHLLPLSAQSTEPPVMTLRDYFSPQGAATASCLGCHDNRDAAAHAYLNTTTFGGTTGPAEACATCHGVGKDQDVAKAHAR